MEINLATIIFLMKTRFTGRRFRHHITLIIVVVSDDMNANFNISLGPLCSLSPGRIVGVLLLNRFGSPQKTNMSLATQHVQHTRLLSQSRHAALGWHGKHLTHVYACETSEAERMRRTILSQVKCKDKSGYDTPLHIWTCAVTGRQCERKGVKLKKETSTEDSVYMTALPRATTDTHTHTQPRVQAGWNNRQHHRHFKTTYPHWSASETSTRYTHATFTDPQSPPLLLRLVIQLCSTTATAGVTALSASHLSHHSCINTSCAQSFIM